jgi:hypothetical protein
MNTDQILESFLKAHSIAVETLTEKQLASALRQAIECGDFTRNVRVTDNAQAVIYIPFAREQALKANKAELLEALQDLLGAAVHCDPHFAARWEREATQARAAITKATT